jgi:diaminopropionate ammonia-lyase
MRADGDVSNMGRLDCKEPSLIAFDVLKNAADLFVTVSDQQAADAVKVLDQQNIGSTPSGAAGLAAMLEADLPADARALIIVSEGRE